jgi:hypothetical protein
MISFSIDLSEAFVLVPPSVSPEHACQYMGRACKCFAVIIYNLSKREDGFNLVTHLIMEGEKRKVEILPSQAVLTIHLEIDLSTGSGEYSVGIFPTLGVKYLQPQPVITTGGVLLDCYLSTTYPGNTEHCRSKMFDLATDAGVYPERVAEAFVEWRPESSDGDPASANELFANQEAWWRYRRKVGDEAGRQRSMKAFGVTPGERPRDEPRDDGMSLGVTFDTAGRMVFNPAATGAVIAQVNTSAIDSMRRRMRRTVGASATDEEIEELVHAAIGDIIRAQDELTF